MSWVTRLLARIRDEEPFDALEPVRPAVTPDPFDAAELQRRIDSVDYKPTHGFHRDRKDHEPA